MGSRALLICSKNIFANSTQPCKYLSTSTTLSAGKNVTDIDKALQIRDPAQKTPKEFFKSKERHAHDKGLKGYITIESEENAVGIVSGVPEEHIKTRTVCISKPTKNAMQSGTHNTKGWQISFDTRERWENPLMGWCSSADPLQATRVSFTKLEQAIEHCKNMGWNYTVQKPNVDDAPPRSYGTNFSWDKRTRVTTK